MSAERSIAAGDAVLAWICPQVPVASAGQPVRLERFSAETARLLAGQIGPLANVKSSSGCGVRFSSDSPWVALRLERLRHHQPGPVGVALESLGADGDVLVADSPDLRGVDGTVEIRLATGAVPGRMRTLTWWLPLISTCTVSAVVVAADARVEWSPAPAARWLAIGDSLTQGFCVQSPVQDWVSRVSRRLRLPVWNLGIGGIRIEPAVFAPALAAKSWDLVTIALGSNHCWKDADAATAGARASELAELAMSGGHERVVWILPPWKPCEDGQGPPDFAGVILDRATGDRVRAVRAAMRDRLAGEPGLELIEDLMPHDARILPDGLHPQALGHGRYGDAVARVLGAEPLAPGAPG
jgi:lysophospholipase L1-like esterase